MNKEIKEIINKYQYDKKTKKYSHKYYFQDNSFYSRVKNNSDVDRALNNVINNISYYENFNYDLVRDDIVSLEESMAQYEEAIHKLLACFDNPNCDFNYTADELMQLINNWDIFEKKISEIRFRKACQD